VIREQQLIFLTKNRNKNL